MGVSDPPPMFLAFSLEWSFSMRLPGGNASSATGLPVGSSYNTSIPTDSRSHAPSAGATLGHYEIKAPLGTGGMGRSDWRRAGSA